MEINKYVISDIHGCVQTFKALLNKIGFSKMDELYLLGDYVDRGPDSKGVIDHIMALTQEGYQVSALWGNHEQMLFDEILGVSWPGGPPETLKSFGVTHVKDVDYKYIEWLKQLEYYIEVDQFILVHAGLNFKLDSPFDDKYDLLWIRNWYKDIDYDWLGSRTIIHGHTPSTLLKMKWQVQSHQEIRAIGIDNGCVFDSLEFGHLACLNLKNMKLTFQKNIDGYY